MSLLLLDTTTHPAVQTLPSGIKFTMVAIPAGSYAMDDGEHIITFTQPFYIGQFPVTQDLYEDVLKQNPSQFKGKKRPVENINWLNSALFCNRLNQQCGYPVRYFTDAEFTEPVDNIVDRVTTFIKFDHFGYRLPSEAEWEYAAAGAINKQIYNYSGSDKLEESGWFYNNSNFETKSVGLKMSNELNIYDMSGNVWEWCEDNWGRVKTIPQDGRSKCEMSEIEHVQRGGSWSSYSDYCRIGPRYWLDYKKLNIGFRLAFSPQTSNVITFI